MLTAESNLDPAVTTSAAAAGPGGAKTANESTPIVDMLRRPESWPDRPKQVELIETHISWVFLGDRFVYKLKKPVRFEFLDLSTLDRRRRACLDEVRLNRRLAPDIYLGVVPVTRGPRGPELDAAGPVIDWVVKMRRLPAERMLDRLIVAHQLQPRDLDRLGQTLARFYTAQPPLLIRPEEYRAAVLHHVVANGEELGRPEHDLDEDAVARVQSAQLRCLALSPELFDRRVCDGRIIDGHGDLRPEHVCLTEPPVVYDCVEFSADLRRVDVLDELCFLALECERLGAPDVGAHVIEAYRRRSGDAPPQRLLDFFRAYRACVRAKVAVLRGDQSPAARASSLLLAREYLALAERHAAPLAPPLLILVRGLMGAGKSTLAAALSQRLGIRCLETDAVRRELFGVSARPAGYGQDHYRPAATDQVYELLLLRAESLLARGQSAILDGSFISARHRRMAEEIARKHGAHWQAVHCHCPDDVARDRITRRAASGTVLSEARADLLDRQKASEEPSTDRAHEIEIDTQDTISAGIERTLASLASTAG